MRAFITGVTGFAGSYLSEHLLECGDAVLGCSRSGGWPDGIPARVSKEVELFAWDLSQGASVDIRRRLEDFAPEAIFHLAAVSVPAECGEVDPSADAIAANVVGTEVLVQLAATLSSRPTFLFASSCYVYAPVASASPVVNEDSPTDPRGGYAKTKWSAEQTISRVAQESGTPAVIARAFQHSGPRQSPRMILPDWARQFAAGGNEPIRVVCLDTFLDISDVRDVVQAYRALVRSGGSGVYNVGSGRTYRSGDLLAEMQELSGTRRQVIESAPGHRQHPIADVRRLIDQTRWQPRIPLRETLKDILEYWHQRKE